MLQGAATLHFAVGFLLYHPEINSCVSLSLALWLLGAEIKNQQRTTETAVVFFSLGNETTSGQSKGAQDARRRISLPRPLQAKLQPWDPLTPQNLVDSRHLSALLSPSSLSHLGAGLRIPSIPSWPGPSSLLRWGGQCLLSTSLSTSAEWDHDTYLAL